MSAYLSFGIFRVGGLVRRKKAGISGRSRLGPLLGNGRPFCGPMIHGPLAGLGIGEALGFGNRLNVPAPTFLLAVVVDGPQILIFVRAGQRHAMPMVPFDALFRPERAGGIPGN